MATISQNETITVQDDKVAIRDFSTRDSDIVSYFVNLDKSEDLEQRLENVLKMGIVATKSIGVTENVQYVEKAFENLDGKMKEELRQAFGEDGKFSEILKYHFGEDGKTIRDLFDPNKEGSPLYSLRENLEKNLSEIKQELGVSMGQEQEREKGTQKGIDFEDDCMEKLQVIASVHSDKLARTSNESGKLSSSKKGDFVLTLGDTGKRIVIETKNTKVSFPTIQKELNEAMENREADYGVLVAKKKDHLPKQVGWFNEYDGNQLVCAMETEEGDSLIDGEMIDIAYKWAKARLQAESTMEKKLDPAFITEKISVVKNRIEDLKKIKTQCGNIEKATTVIRQTAESAKKNIADDLDEIMESLNSGE